MTEFGLMIGPLPQSRATGRLALLARRLMPAPHTLTDLRYASLPHHTPYTDVPAPTAGLEWRRDIAAAEALIILAPTHTRSIPGMLKNALDWAGADGTRGPLEGKPVAIAGVAAPNQGTFAAIQHLRTILLDAGAVLLGQPERTLEVAEGALSDDGTCADPALFADMEELLRAAAGHAVHEQRARAVSSPTTAPLSPLSPLAGIPLSPAAGVPLSPVAGVPAAAPAAEAG